MSILRGLREVLGPVIAQPFQLSDISTFPDSEFSVNRARYNTYWGWYQGTPLLEMQQLSNGKAVPKFPIRVNPLHNAVIKHAYALFGEFSEDSRPLVSPNFKPDKREDREAATFAESIVNKVWWENNGRSIMMRNALLAQVMGGCVFRLSYTPLTPGRDDTWRSIPIRIDSVPPTNFIGIPYAGDEYRLKEAWVVQAITYLDAATMGVEVPQDQQVYYVEHYLPDRIEFRINGWSIPTGLQDVNGNPTYWGGPNPFGFVPIVYIPHIRTQGFYGESHVSEAVKGIIFELNARLADLGDATTDDSHKYYFMRNVAGRPEVVDIAPGLRVVNGGINPGITGKEAQPDISEISGQRLTTPMKDFVENLILQFRREVAVPAVSDGEDEGSQRSALTLAMRMWPLISHTKTERVFWQDGLSVLTRMMVKMMLIKNMVPELDPKVESMRIEQRWSPLLPTDRESLINEIVSRAGANIGSIEHLMELTHDIEDPEEEKERILAWMKETGKVEAENAPKPAGVGGGNQSQKKATQNKRSDSE